MPKKPTRLLNKDATLHGGRPTPVLTFDQRLNFLEAARQRSQQIGLLLRTLYETGVRGTELIKLCAEDLDCDKETLIIQDSKEPGLKRLVYIPPPLIVDLCDYLNERTTGTLFRSSRNRPYSKSRLQRIITEVADAAGFPFKVTAHSIRQTRATDLASAGFPVWQLIGMIGQVSGVTDGFTGQPPNRKEYERAYRLTMHR